MKKLLVVALFCFIFNIAFAAELEPVKIDYKPTLSFESRFEKIEGTINAFNFIPLSKEEYKDLSPVNKKKYNNMKKSYEYWQKALYAKNNSDIIKYSEKALSYYELYPVLYNLVHFYDGQKDYKNAAYYSERLINLGYNINYLTYFYYVMYLSKLNRYDDCIKAGRIYFDYSNDSNLDGGVYLAMADSYYNLNDYNNAIIYADKAINANPIIEKMATEIKYMAYFKQNKKAEANKEAIKLYDWKYPNIYDASLRVAASSSSDVTRMKYYEIAKQNAKDTIQKWAVNTLIALIDEKKLNNICDKTSGFIDKPLWSEIIKSDNNLMDLDTQVKRFDDYHKDLNNCMCNYQGNDFKNCIKALKDKQDKISQKLYNDQQELNRQLAEEERLRQLRIMNANLQQQNYLQQQNNYLQQQQNIRLQQLQNQSTSCYKSGNNVYCNSY